MLKPLILSVLIALPVQSVAAGSISILISPRSAEEADALRLGLAFFALREDIRGGRVTQDGVDNIARLAQSGSRNLGIIRQRGSGHNGTINQSGDGNVYGLFQSGRGASARISQDGNNGAGLLLQYGW